MRFSNRTDWNLTPNELTRRVGQLRARGHSLLDLTETNPTHCQFQYPSEEILGALSQQSALSYDPTPKGLFTAREAVARYYQARAVRTVDPQRLVLTASTSEAYSFLFRLLADPDDEILVPQPSYPLFDFLAQLSDVHLRPYRLEYDTGWHLDFHSLEQAYSSRSRAVIAVHPNNPTGSGVSLRDRSPLMSFCRERSLALIVDEVFADFGFDASSNALSSFAGEQETLTMVLNGISKMVGLPQMKLAWVAVSGPPDSVEPAMERLEVIADTYLSVGTPIQQALPVLLEKVRAKIQPQILDRVRTNLRLLDESTGKTSGLCKRLAADGGWSSVVSIPRTRSEEDWVLRWLELDHVLVHPGYFFDFPRDGYVVISLLPPPEIFQKAVQKLIARVLSEVRG